MPLDVMSQLYELIKDKGFDPKVSDKSWKIKFEGKVEAKEIEMEEVKAEEEEESKKTKVFFKRKQEAMLK